MRLLLSLLALLLAPPDAPGNAPSLTPVWTLGAGAEDVYDGLPLYKIRDVAVAPDGTVYVSDGGNHRVLVFDADGAFVRSFGRAGEGPGEFVSLSRLALDGDTLYALDIRLRRLSLFTRDGAYLRSFSLGEMAADLAVRDGRLYLTYFSPRAKEALIRVYDVATEARVQQVGAPHATTVAVNRAGAAGRLALAGDGVYFAHASPYRIERFAPGGTLRGAVDRAHPAFKPPSDAPGGGGGMMMGGTLSASIRGFAVRPDGRLLVQLRLEDAPPVIEVLAPDGTLQQHLALPPEHQLAEAAGDHVYTFVHGGDEALPMVTKWRLPG